MSHAALDDPPSSVAWRYAVMNFGLTVPAQASSFLLLYYVDGQKLSPTLAATVMACFAVYNAIDNPVIGYLSDRSRSRQGRRIPFIRYGALPSLLGFVLMFNAPFSGATEPWALVAYFAATWWLWETAGTALGTGYLALLPEMFRTYAQRTGVAWRMNAVQVVGLLIGLALPPVLAARFGWGVTAAAFAVISGVAIYSGVGALRERPEAQQTQSLPLLPALRATFSNRSFLTVVLAQTMRFVTTGTLAAGMGFYVKYTLGAPEGTTTTLLLATAFVVAGASLWPWRALVASRFGARTTLMLAFAVTAVSVSLLAVVDSVAGVWPVTAAFGVGLGGMILMGDVIMADVIDEDEVRTGERREGMYFGLSGLITTLSGALISLAFGWVSRRYGYDPTLDVQPASVAEGFRVFMTAVPIAGAALALLLLAFYPLHGQRLADVRRTLAERRAA
ncbi:MULTISPECIES: MFS transporter [Deinococcus]|uniref:MFS transporter n=1 Tax=Deinococcus rufus TaxID=2136097 RepID=A0ABV7Z620_9DEIO|nr:MFS transporter [Deinococcus sp. AB2017081]WQE95914.1 MFS transporter [Deinococcus sp. AB2017081]